LQFIVKFVAAIVPYLLRFLDKHSDEYLEMLNKRIVKFIDGDKTAIIKLDIINKNGEPVNDVYVGFSIEKFGKIYKKSEGNAAIITGLQEGVHNFNICGKEVSIEVEDINTVIEKTVVV
jgi:hypothetical protein